MSSTPLLASANNSLTIGLTIPMLVFFFALMIGVGLYCRRHSTNVEGFVLGGRSVGPWLTAFAFGTSYFSAVIFVGYAGQFGWNFGLASTWIGLGNAFIGSLLAWSVLGRRTRVMSQHLGSKTMPDFFEKRYDSKKLKVIASFIVFVFLIPYTASLYNGLSSLFNNVFSISTNLIIISLKVLLLRTFQSPQTNFRLRVHRNAHSIRSIHQQTDKSSFLPEEQEALLCLHYPEAQ